MKTARRIFNVAGVYGVLALVPQYFMEGRIGRDFPPAITHPEHFYGFIGVALAWQLFFFIIARDPERYRGAMWPAMFEKMSFGVATLLLFGQGRVPLPIMLAGVVDVVFAVLFFVAWRLTARTLAE
jgi:hypothetical protein